MAKNNRNEVAKRLTQEIKTTKDPQTLIELTKQLAKVLPKRKSVAKPTPGPKSTYVPNGSAMGSLPLGEQTLNRVVMALEDASRKCRLEQGRDWTEVEKYVVLQQTFTAFSDNERAAYFALDTERG